MKTALAAGFAAFILLISFQNCQPPPHADEISAASLSSNGSTTKIDLDSEVVDSVQFLVQDSQVVSKAGRSYQVNFNRTLQVDLQTGVITASSDLDGATATFCLNETMKSELVSILKSSQICKSGALSGGRVCGQSLKLPYASIVTGQGSYDLGSASDTCGSNSVDLCDGQDSALKGFIAAVKSGYTQMACE